MAHTAKENNRPVFEARLNAVRVAVFENQHEDSTWYSATISRTYKDNGEYKTSHTLNGVADLVLASEALSQAKDFMQEAEKQAKDFMQEAEKQAKGA